MADDVVQIPWSFNGNEENPQPTEADQNPVQVPKKQKHKAIMRPEEEVILLKEAVAIFPWGVPRNKRVAAWEAIVKAANLTIEPERHLDVRRARERLTVLLDKHRADEMESLRASGTEEDYTERTQLLTDLHEMLADEKQTTKEAMQDKEEEERQGEFLRAAAMEGMRRNSDVMDSDISSESSKRIKLAPRKQKVRSGEIDKKLEIFMESERVARESEVSLLARACNLEESRQELENRRLALEEKRHEDQQLQIQQLMAFLSQNMQAPK